MRILIPSLFAHLSQLLNRLRFPLLTLSLSLHCRKIHCIQLTLHMIWS
jgi:hypothetical protein